MYNKAPRKPSEAESAALKPPQFGLRTLLGLVTACAALFALLQWLHPAAVALVGFLGVSVFCHVAGNAIGTRLRQLGDRGELEDCEPRMIVSPKAHDFAPITDLSRRQGLGWLVLIATSVGIASGAVGGGLWTFVSAHGQAGVADILIGVIAFGFLGGIAAFGVFSFAQVLSGALWQALRAPVAPAAAGALGEPAAQSACPDAFPS